MIKALKNDKGASLVEYGITIGLIATMSIAVVLQLGEQVERTFQSVESELGGSVDVALGDTVNGDDSGAFVPDPASVHTQTITWSGGAARMSFPTASVPQPSVWDLYAATSDPASVCAVLGYPSVENAVIMSTRFEDTSSFQGITSIPVNEQTGPGIWDYTVMWELTNDPDDLNDPMNDGSWWVSSVEVINEIACQ